MPPGFRSGSPRQSPSFMFSPPLCAVLASNPTSWPSSPESMARLMASELAADVWSLWPTPMTTPDFFWTSSS